MYIDATKALEAHDTRTGNIIKSTNREKRILTKYGIEIPYFLASIDCEAQPDHVHVRGYPNPILD